MKAVARRRRLAARPAAPTARSCKTVKARDLWDKIGDAAWACADPGRAVRHHHQRLAHLPGRRADQRLEPVLASTCSSTTPPATWRRSTSSSSSTSRPVRRRGLRPRHPRSGRWRSRSRSLMAQFPSPRIAERSYDYRTLGLGYANLGTLLMRMGIPYDSPEGRALCGALTAIMTGEAYAASRRDGAASSAPFPGYAQNRDAMLRVIRNHRRAAAGPPRRLRGPERAAGRARPRQLPRLRAPRPRARGLGRGARPRREARLPQRAGHGDRAHRHHRPRDGLRHHRHRARLRAREVQEARRRRLLQDRQPARCRRRSQPRLQPERRSRRSSPTSSATARSTARPTINRDRAERPRLRRAPRSRRSRRRCRPSSTSASPSTSGRSARSSAPASSASRPTSCATRPSTSSSTSASPAPQIDEANDYVCGTMTVEGAPHLQARALSGVRLREPLRQERQALPRGREPHPDDGRGAAVPLGRDLQDDQPAERRDDRRRARRPTSWRW